MLQNNYIEKKQKKMYCFHGYGQVSQKYIKKIHIVFS
jgi:hypothetical protein